MTTRPPSSWHSRATMAKDRQMSFHFFLWALRRLRPPFNLRFTHCQGLPPVHGIEDQSMQLGSPTAARALLRPASVDTSSLMVNLTTSVSLGQFTGSPILEFSPQQNSTIVLFMTAQSRCAHSQSWSMCCSWLERPLSSRSFCTRGSNVTPHDILSPGCARPASQASRTSSSPLGGISSGGTCAFSHGL